MNKKVIGMILGSIAVASLLPVRADTTGAVATGISTDNFTIAVDPVTKQITVTTTGITTTGGSITTGAENTTGTIQDTGADLSTGTEFEKALAWMYANGLTKYDNATEYRPDDSLLREEAAKIIGQAFVSLGYAQTVKNTSCTFHDIQTVDPSLSWYVTNACKRWLFKGTTEGNFIPKEQLSRPQSMAVLVRMFEGDISNENLTPRRSEYYIKGQALGLTNLNNKTLFDSYITRKEIAIYIYRLKNIISNNIIRANMLAKLAALESTGDNTSNVVNDLSALASSTSISNDPELIEAIKWMNDNGLTNYTDVVTYKPFEALTREQSAKILSKFAEIYRFGSINSEWICVFADSNTFDTSLSTYITNVCQLGIMQGANGYFYPKTTISKAQFIAAMIRLFEGKKLDETQTPRWTTYFEEAENMGMVNPSDSIAFDNTITRYEVALFLYRFKVKYQITQNLNSETIENQVISTVSGSIITGTNGLPQSNVYVDMNLLQNGNFNVGYVEFFGKRYKVVKSATEKYLTNSLNRFGDIFTLDTQVKTGTTSFIISDTSLIEGTLRLSNGSTFVINPISNTKAYYTISQTK